MHEVTCVKVKGHGDNELNARCDRLAVAARERLKAQCLRLPLALTLQAVGCRAWAPPCTG
jgi:hypothetical protein